MTTVIKKKRFAPAREIVDTRLRQLMRGKIHIGGGPGVNGNGMMPSDKTVCIMEATAYILGYSYIDDAPPCTSETIRNVMISINDGIHSNRKRARLKVVIPEIVNTAPIEWYEDWDIAGNRVKRVRTVYNNPEYKRAEEERRRIQDAALKAFVERAGKNKIALSDYDYEDEDISSWDAVAHLISWGAVAHLITKGRIKVDEVLDVIREMAAVAKFDTLNEEASQA
jgi:hypothetical protein